MINVNVYCRMLKQNYNLKTMNYLIMKLDNLFLNYDYKSNIEKINKFYSNILIKLDGKDIFNKKYKIVIINNTVDTLPLRYYGLKHMFSKLEVIEILKNNHLYKDCVNTVYFYNGDVRINNYVEWFNVDDNIYELQNYLM